MFGDDANFMAAVHQTLQRGDVIRIRHDPPFESEDFHVFVVLNVDPAKEELLLLVSGTSQVQKRLEARLRISADDGQYVADTTLVLPAESYSFITKSTLFDCNEVHTVQLEAIRRNDMITVSTSLSAEHVSSLIEKVGNSKLVAPVIKRQLGL